MKFGLAAMVVVFGLMMGARLAEASSLTPDLHALAPFHQAAVRDGDFDGDGRRDTVVLVTEADSGRIAVHVRLNTAEGVKDVRVTSLDADANTAPNLHVVASGRYRADSGTYSSSGSAYVEADHDSLMLSVDGATSVLLHWQGDHFEQDFVRSDEALMTQALVALYALNR